MNNSINHETLMAYLYGELDEPTRRRVEQFIKENPDARAELNRLSDFRQMLADVPAVEVPSMEVNKLLPKPQRRINWYRWISTAAAVALLGLIWFNTKIEVGSNGLVIQFGDSKNEQLADEKFTAEINLAKAEIEKMQVELAALKNSPSDEQVDLNPIETRITNLEQQPQLTRAQIEKLNEAYYQSQIPKMVAAIQNTQTSNTEEYTELLNDIIYQIQEQRETDMQAIASRLMYLQNNVNTHRQETNEKFEVLLTSTLSDD